MLVTPELLIGLLAEPKRLRVFAAVVLGARTSAQVSEVSGVDQRTVGRALARLADGGLVAQHADGYLPLPDVFKQVAIATAPAEPAAPGHADDRVAAVLGRFIRDGRLRSMPAQAGRRQVVLAHIVLAFEPGRSYREPEVNAILRSWTDGGSVDHVTVRRYLVDAGLLCRDGDTYWRCGGWVDVIGPDRA